MWCRGAVAVGMVGAKTQPAVQREGGLVQCADLQVRRPCLMLIGPLQQGPHHGQPEALAPPRRHDVHRRDPCPGTLDADPTDRDRLAT